MFVVTVETSGSGVEWRRGAMTGPASRRPLGVSPTGGYSWTAAPPSPTIVFTRTCTAVNTDTSLQRDERGELTLTEKSEPLTS